MLIIEPFADQTLNAPSILVIPVLLQSGRYKKIDTLIPSIAYLHTFQDQRLILLQPLKTKSWVNFKPNLISIDNKLIQQAPIRVFLRISGFVRTCTLGHKMHYKKLLCKKF